MSVARAELGQRARFHPKSEPPRVCRRPFCLSHAARALSFSPAKHRSSASGVVHTIKVTVVVCAWRDIPACNSDLSHECAPLYQRGQASLFVNLPRDEMALLIEIVVDPGVN